ncbi:MAG: class I tRNA ligase family protein, partial [Patescibacteria group bacterium]
NAMQTWVSPWGAGFPGWHIECSAMAKKYLGTTIDIHMGGIEHVPVHHTNEIAQSEAANGVKFVNYWLHNEHLTVNNAKMSKSEGTAYSLPEVKAKGYDALALRYFFLNAHYRSKQNFSWEGLGAAATSFKKLQNKIRELKEAAKLSSEKIEPADINEHYRGQFISAIEDDVNIPQALALLWELLKDDKLTADEILATAYDFDRIFSLKLAKIKLTKIMLPEKIQALIDNRQKFREVGDFAEADKIRAKIEKLGYKIKDTPNGVVTNKKTGGN